MPSQGERERWKQTPNTRWNWDKAGEEEKEKEQKWRQNQTPGKPKTPKPPPPPPPAYEKRAPPLRKVQTTTLKEFQALRGTQEESIYKGETIHEDWEPWSEREARLKEEAEARGEEFHPESDYEIGERQSADYERAKQMAERRKEKERERERERKNDTSREPALSFNPNKTGARTGTGSNRFWNDQDRKPWARPIEQNEREEQDKKSNTTSREDKKNWIKPSEKKKKHVHNQKQEVEASKKTPNPNPRETPDQGKEEIEATAENAEMTTTKNSWKKKRKKNGTEQERE